MPRARTRWTCCCGARRSWTCTRAGLAYERWMPTRDDARLKEITAYNEEDCRATLALRDWLLDQRPREGAWTGRPAPHEIDDTQQARDAEREALRQALVT